MNPLRGINQDISPNELPDGFYSYAKNILLSSTFNAVENEQGFFDSTINSNGSYKELYDLGLRPIGIVSTTKFEVFWLTNNTRSVIGTYNQDTDTFTVVYDDSTKPALNLNLLYPIKAVWRENFLGEIYVAWTDRLNKVKILNLQKANKVNNEKDILLFPEFIQPDITTEIQNSGNLTAGTYYGYVQYSTNDGKTTDYSLATSPLYITVDPQNNTSDNFFGTVTVTTSKSIKFTISNIDTAYDKLTLAIQRINKGNDVKDFVIVSSRNIGGVSSMEIVYTGGEIAETLTPDDVLVKAPLYDKAATLTTLNSQLILGNLVSLQENDIQKYVNNWKVKWITSEINSDNLSELPKYSTPKSFAHNEVYALYASLLFKSGKVSQAFVIPGRAASTVTVGAKVFNENATIKATDNLPAEVGYTGDTSFLTEDFSLNTGDVKYFQTRDTCSWNGTTGTMGYWENETENYPDTEDYDIYDSTGKIGTLKNTKVRHHKFPSNSYIKDTLYPADNQYGTSKIDRLGIKLEDVYLPQEILDNVDKIIISQAKRTFGNSLVICQEKTTFMGYYKSTVNNGETSTVPGGWSTLPTTSIIYRKGQNVSNAFVDLPVIALEGSTVLINVEPSSVFPNGSTIHCVDTSNSSRTFSATVGFRIGDSLSVAVTEVDGFPPLSFISGAYHINLEGEFDIKLFTPDEQVFPITSGTAPDYFRLKLHSPEIINLNPNLNSTYLKLNYKTITYLPVNKSDKNIYAQDSSKISSQVTNSKKIIKVQEFRYIENNIVNYPTNSVVFSDWLKLSENGAIIKIPKKFDFSGTSDNLELLHKFEITDDGTNVWYGITDLLYPTGESPILNDSGYQYTLNKFYTNVYSSYVSQELVIVDKFSYTNRNSVEIFNADCFLDYYGFNTFGGYPGKETPEFPDTDATIRLNFKQFIETSLNSGMRHSTGLKDSFVRAGNTDYLFDPNLVYAGNYVTINPDFNKINEDLSYTIFESSESFTNSFPHRIIKSLPITSESKVQQWSSFLPLDYYEIDKSKGVIVNLQGAIDRLLIHTERALFITRDKARLGTDIGQVNLTSGELFDFAPQEVLPTNNGFTGTQHMFSCALLNEGYFWVDAQSGRVFIYNFESLKEISNQGLYNFFANNLGMFEDSPFNSNGITVTNDLRYNRILVSIKNGTNNYTLSYLKDLNQGQGGWVSFHDYDSDCLFSSRKNTFSFKEGKLYRHNSPEIRGVYYDEKFSSFIDITMNSQSVISSNNGKRVFNDKSIYLNSVEWNTDFSDTNEVYDADRTISHLTVRNQYQHSSRLELNYNTLSITSDTNSRNAEFRWHCNTFRDLVANKRLPFIQDIFNNFDEISGNIDINQPWFDQEQFNNRWFVIRLEYDNLDDYKMVLHSVDINKTDSYR